MPISLLAVYLTRGHVQEPVMLLRLQRTIWCHQMASSSFTREKDILHSGKHNWRQVPGILQEKLSQEGWEMIPIMIHTKKFASENLYFLKHFETKASHIYIHCVPLTPSSHRPCKQQWERTPFSVVTLPWKTHAKHSVLWYLLSISLYLRSRRIYIWFLISHICA